MGNKPGKEFALLILGLGMLGSGLVLFFTRAQVYMASYVYWGAFGNMGFNGIMFIPFILGIILWVIFPKNIWPKILTWVSVVSIILAIISMLRFGFRSSAFELFIYIILIFVGGALAFKVLVIDDPKRGKKDDK